MSLFPEPVQNRRLTPKEMEDEIEISRIFKRHCRTFLLDKPFYPYVPTVPYHTVNFDLNYPPKK